MSVAIFFSQACASRQSGLIGESRFDEAARVVVNVYNDHCTNNFLFPNQIDDRTFPSISNINTLHDALHWTISNIIWNHPIRRKIDVFWPYETSCFYLKLWHFFSNPPLRCRLQICKSRIRPLTGDFWHHPFIYDALSKVRYSSELEDASR